MTEKAYAQHLVRGGELLRAEKIDDARVELEAAIALKPGDGKILNLLGLAYFRLGRYDDARTIYAELVDRNPSDGAMRLNLGLVHLKTGSVDDAIRELQRARDLDPSQVRTMGYLGLAYARKGKYALAREAFLAAGQDDLAREMEEQMKPTNGVAAPVVIAPAPPAETPTVEEQAPPVVTLVPEAAPVAEPAPVAPVEAPPALVEIAPAAVVPAPAAAAAIPVLDLLPPKRAVTPPPIPATAASKAKAAQTSPSPAASAFETQPMRRRAQSVSDLLPGPPTPAAPSGIASALEGMRPRGVSVMEPLPGPPPGAALPTVTSFAANRLIRPDDGDEPFELGAGDSLIVRVRGRVLSRTEGVIVSGGELAYEPATKRIRGRVTEDPFGSEKRPMFIVTGKGHLVALPRGGTFLALQLVDDVMYVREDLVFAFEERLGWENGHVPGSSGGIPVVQFRGEGAIAVRTRKQPLAVKLAPEKILYIDATSLAGWIGRVIPRVVQPAAGGDASAPFVECTGEGVVLIEEPIADGADGADGDAAPVAPAKPEG